MVSVSAADGGGVVVELDTSTLTLLEVAVLADKSFACAVRTCVPLLACVVSHETWYGAVVAAAPRFAPSTLNCTLAMPMLEDALAVTVVVPLTVAPETG